LILPRQPISTLFPYTTLFRSQHYCQSSLPDGLRGSLSADGHGERDAAGSERSSPPTRRISSLSRQARVLVHGSSSDRRKPSRNDGGLWYRLLSRKTSSLTIWPNRKIQRETSRDDREMVRDAWEERCSASAVRPVAAHPNRLPRRNRKDGHETLPSLFCDRNTC